MSSASRTGSIGSTSSTSSTMPHLMSFRRKWLAGYCHKADLAARPEAVASVFNGPVEYILRVVRPLGRAESIRRPLQAPQHSEVVLLSFDVALPELEGASVAGSDFNHSLRKIDVGHLVVNRLALDCHCTM